MGKSRACMSEALAECLEVIMRREDVSKCLDKYPQYHEDLQALLDLILKVKAVSKETNPPPSLAQQLNELLIPNS